MTLPSWKTVFRRGIVPLVTLEQLEALRVALQDDAPFLIQGAATSPPPVMAVQDFPVEGCDALTYLFVSGLGGIGVCTVGEAEEAFAIACHAMDQTLGEPAGCRKWLNHWDEEPRDTLFRDVLFEVSLAIGLLLTEFQKDTPIPIVADALRDMGRDDLADVLFPLPTGVKT